MTTSSRPAAPVFDVIVFGLGGMGMAAAYHLAARGQRVLGLDQFTPPHDQGSSHGESRVIRQAYFEDPAYVPLLLRAYELWRRLQKDSGRQLLTITGGLMLGTKDSAVVAGSLKSAREHGLPHDLLDAAEIKKRFPLFAPEPDTMALFEKSAGFVRPEKAVDAHRTLAEKAGAILQYSEEVTNWTASETSVRVTTRQGSYEAGQLVICAGSWLGKVAKDLALPISVERQVQFWFRPAGDIESFTPDKFPVWIWETKDGSHPYGLPLTGELNDGVKVSVHHGGKNSICTPDTIDRFVSENEIEAARGVIMKYLPALTGPCMRTATCMYTNAPDGHFILDRHPAHQRVLIVSPCSGHGFKFCPVIGEIVAELVTSNHTAHNISRFKLART